MSESNSGKELRVVEACTKQWDELEGGRSKRFCAECQLHVYDSTALTRAEAQDLARDAESRLCMRLVQDSGGRTLYRDSPRKPTRAASPWGNLSRWTLVAGAGLLSACQGSYSDEQLDPGAEGNGSTTSGQAHPQGSMTELGEVGTIEILGDVLGQPLCPDPTDEAIVDDCEDDQGQVILGRIAVECIEAPDPMAQD